MPSIIIGRSKINNILQHAAATRMGKQFNHSQEQHTGRIREGSGVI